MEAIPAQYHSGKYIAEIFAIRDTELEFIPPITFSGNIQPATSYTSQVYTAGAINTTVDIELITTPATTGYLIFSGSINGTGMT